jgi:hypothetical protein
MRGRFIHQAVLGILLICQLTVCLATETADADYSSKYLDAVRTFAHKPETLFGVVEDY